MVIKPSKLNIVAQGLSNSLPHSIPQPLYTLLSRVGSDQGAGKRAGRVHYEKREVAQHLYFIHTVKQAWWCRATLHLYHPWSCALGQAMRQASALVRDTCHLVKERKNTNVLYETNAHFYGIAVNKICGKLFNLITYCYCSCLWLNTVTFTVVILCHSVMIFAYCSMSVCLVLRYWVTLYVLKWTLVLN